MNDTPTPSRQLRALYAAVSILWWLLVGLWLALALAWGALHLWIVPRIDEWRPVLEREASRVLGVAVRIGEVSARSDSLMPSIELTQVVLLDGQAREALRLPRVVIVVSPRSLLDLGFEQMYVERPDLEVRRGPDGRIWVAGLELGTRGGDTAAAADWFFGQREVVVLGGRLRWVDEQRGAAPLVLTDLRFVARNSARRHALRVDAVPPAEWGTQFTALGVFRSPLLSQHPGRWQDWSGEMHADFSSVDLSQLRPYAALGVDLRQGQGQVRAWADLERGQVTSAQADVDLRAVEAVLAEGRPALALRTLSGQLQGRRLGEGFELESRDLRFETLDGQRWPGGNFALAWEPAQGPRPERGRLRADRLDLQALAQVADRLPLPEARRELLAHLPTGRVEQLEASWEGPASAMTRYKVKGRATALALAPDPATRRPGLRGFSLDADFNEAGGKARLALERGTLELPTLLAEPTVPLERLAADLQWQRANDGRWSVNATGLRLSNADFQAEGQVSWRSADPARGPGPGSLDLQIALPRAEGQRVWRYLPLSVSQATRDYVREAVLAGRVSEGRVRVRGDLRDFPYTNPATGEFRVSARLRDVQYAYVPRASTRGGAPAGASAWPPLVGLSGELVFERAGMELRRVQARVGGPGGPGLQVQADAVIANLSEAVVGVTGSVRGPMAEALSVFNALPVAQTLGQPLERAVATGPAEVRLQLALPLAGLDRSRVQGSVALNGNDIQLAPGVPALSRVRGQVQFTERGFTLAGVQARALGGDLRAEGGSRPAPVPPGEAATVLRVQGTASAEALRQARELGLVSRVARQAIGSAPYNAVIGIKPAGIDVNVTSTLQGMSLSLPAPLNKAADAALPLRFDLQHTQAGGRPQDQLRVELGRLAQVHYVRDISVPEAVVLRGAIGIGLAAGETVPLPDQGVSVQAQLAGVNLDDWDQAVSAVLAAVPAPGAAAASVPATAAPRPPMDAVTLSYLPTAYAVRAREITFSGRTVNQITINGSREGLTWKAQVDASQVGGYFEYRQSPGAGPGRLMARMARLSIPATATSDVEALFEQPATSVPAIDAVVEDFELRGKKLGRLEMEAVNRSIGPGGATEWRLNRLALTMPEATLSAQGQWSPSPAAASAPARGGRPTERRRTTMNFRLDIADSGQLLGRLGMKDLVRRGRGKLEGQIAWQGSPLAFDYPSLSGAFNVSLEGGQFLKADPGLAKLLGVLSLQSLPRRLTLDFRDVFSDGFAFDFVRGDVTIAQGIASTNNLQMKGVNAAVLMDGRADIARETQDLRVVVVPEINAGTASVVAGVINPAVGLGSFLAQLFLRQPLIRANTQEFHVDGTWSDPRVTRVPRSAPGPTSAPTPAPAPQGN